MGEMYITLSNGVRLTLVQAVTLADLSREHPDGHWHPNECGCCVTFHPDDRPNVGYVINSDGDAEFIDLG